MTTHLLLRGESLAALNAQIIAEHGSQARIVKAESIVQGGIGGFLAKRFFEVTVEVPTPVPASAQPLTMPSTPGQEPPSGGRGMVLPNRSGIAALLADADEAEDRLADPMTLSTSSVRFDQLFDELSARVASDEAAHSVPNLTEQPQRGGGAGPSFPAPLTRALAPSPAVAQSQSQSQSPSPFPPVTRLPAPLPEPTQSRTPLLPSRLAGDLVLLVGLRTDALRVAHSLSGRFGPASVCVGGTITLKSALRVSGRREAAQARADGVHNGCSVFVAYGIEPGTDVNTALRDIGADQVWVVVDAGRKHEDTRLWVQNLASTVNVHAVAAFGLATTLTPESVQDLGVPVGWADGLLLGS